MKILKRLLLLASFLWVGLVVFVFVILPEPPFGSPPANLRNPAAVLREHVEQIVKENATVFSINSNLSDMEYVAQYLAAKKRYCDSQPPSKGGPTYAELFICGEPVDSYSFNIRKSYEELLNSPPPPAPSALGWYLKGVLKLLAFIFIPIAVLILAFEAGIRILRKWDKRDTLI